MNYRRYRNRILLEMLRDTEGRLDARVSIVDICGRIGLNADQAEDRAFELTRNGLVESFSNNSKRDGYKTSLTLQGKQLAEYISEPWYMKVWLEHKHSIVTGIFSIVSAIIGGIVGGLFVWLFSTT